MLVFKDTFSGDNLLSANFNFKEVHNGLIIEVETKVVAIREGGTDVDSDGAGPRPVNNLVDQFKLKTTGFDKAGYVSHIRKYLKRLIAHVESIDAERADLLAREAEVFSKRILASFDDFQFFTGPSGDSDAMVPVLFYRSDGVTPCVYLWKDGLQCVDEPEER